MSSLRREILPRREGHENDAAPEWLLVLVEEARFLAEHETFFLGKARVEDFISDIQIEFADQVRGHNVLVVQANSDGVVLWMYREAEHLLEHAILPDAGPLGGVFANDECIIVDETPTLHFDVGIILFAHHVEEFRADDVVCPVHRHVHVEGSVARELQAGHLGRSGVRVEAVEDVRGWAEKAEADDKEEHEARAGAEYGVHAALVQEPARGTPEQAAEDSVGDGSYVAKHHPPGHLVLHAGVEGSLKHSIVHVDGVVRATGTSRNRELLNGAHRALSSRRGCAALPDFAIRLEEEHHLCPARLGLEPERMRECNR